MLSDIAVGAERLESVLWPFVVSKPSVQIGSPLSDLPSMLRTVAIDVINVEEMPIGFSAANALPAVGGHHLLSQGLGLPYALLETGCTIFFGGQLLLATLPAKSRCRQARAVALSALSTRLSALPTKSRRVIARPTTIDTASFGCIALAGFEYALRFLCSHNLLYHAYADMSTPKRAPEEAVA